MARQAAASVGLFFLTLHGLSEIIKKIAIMRGDMDDPTPFISAHQAAELEGAELAKSLDAP